MKRPCVFTATGTCLLCGVFLPKRGVACSLGAFGNVLLAVPPLRKTESDSAYGYACALTGGGLPFSGESRIDRASEMLGCHL